MAVDTIGYRRGRGGDAERRAAKEKREKIVLAVCGVILLALLALEGPKMLKRVHGTQAAPAPAATATTASPSSAQPAAAHAAATSAALKRLAPKDPFVAQLGSAEGVPPPEQIAAPPAVRESGFVAKDPFVQQLSASSSTAATPGSSTGPVASDSGASGKSGNYIVVLASIPLSYGRHAAAQAASAARRLGIANVSIVDSSGYPTLRTGFYAVYAGPYPSLGELQPVLEQIRGQGYPSAYTRRLAH
jgi:hypothetical protein